MSAPFTARLKNARPYRKQYGGQRCYSDVLSNQYRTTENDTGFTGDVAVDIDAIHHLAHRAGLVAQCENPCRRKWYRNRFHRTLFHLD